MAAKKRKRVTRRTSRIDALASRVDALESAVEVLAKLLHDEAPQIVRIVNTLDDVVRNHRELKRRLDTWESPKA